MIIQRYILKEVATTLLAVMVVVLLIFFSLRFVRILGDVAAGILPVELVFKLLSLQLVKNIGSIIPLAVFFSVLLAFGRLYRDQEIVAMTASGISQTRLIQFLIRLMLPVLLISATFTLYLSPWAAAKVDILWHEADNRSELSLLVAGRFVESQGGNLTMYVEELSDDQRELKNVFVQSRNGERKSVLSSDTGYRYIDEKSGDEYMVMVNGYRYEGDPGEDDFRITRFAKHAVRLEQKELDKTALHRVSKPNTSLWNSVNTKDIAELQSRIIVPLATIALMILAVPLSRVSPREGQYGRLLSAVFVYVMYNSLYGAAYNWVGRGKISPYIGMWWLPVLLLLVALFIVMWQTRGQSNWLNNKIPWRRDASV